MLRVGERVVVYGGYDMDPAWLAVSASGYVGEVIDFIPSQDDRLAAVVALDEELVLPEGGGSLKGRELRGGFLVLKLAHVGTDWSTPTPRVHVELSEERPERSEAHGAGGAWIESHATYRHIE